MVVKTQPADFESAQFVVAFSDAEDNSAAIREITRWAREHGFVRSTENFLNAKRDEQGNQLYYGACYRLDIADSRAADQDLAAIRAVRDQMPMTAGSETLIDA